MSEPDLFDQPTATEIGMTALASTAAKNAAMIEVLVPLAQELAQATPAGITVSDLRGLALERGVLTGHESGRALSYLGAVMKRAGLHSLGETRRSPLAVTHGIRQTVWALTLPQE